MVGPYIAATIVSLVQYFRGRDRRALPLAALFAFQAQALQREWSDPWRDVFQAAACGAGLVVLLVLRLRPPTMAKTAADAPARGQAHAAPPAEPPSTRPAEREQSE